MKKYLSRFVLVLLFGVNVGHAQDAINQARVQELGQMLGQVQEKMKSNPNMSQEEQKALAMQLMNQSNSGKSMLQKQKDQMPKMLELLKSNRACLSKADTKADVKKCEKAAEKLSKKLGISGDFEDDDEDFVWNEDVKKEALSEMDEGINHMEKILPCIKKAKTMSDMMQCSRK